MVARRWPHFISATAIWIAIVVFPEPPFSFPTTMTCGELRDFTAAFSMAAPRNNQLREGNCHHRARRTTCATCAGEVTRPAVDRNNSVRATLFHFLVDSLHRWMLSVLVLGKCVGVGHFPFASFPSAHDRAQPT